MRVLRVGGFTDFKRREEREIDAGEFRLVLKVAVTVQRVQAVDQDLNLSLEGSTLRRPAPGAV